MGCFFVFFFTFGTSHVKLTLSFWFNFIINYSYFHHDSQPRLRISLTHLKKTDATKYIRNQTTVLFFLSLKPNSSSVRIAFFCLCLPFCNGVQLVRMHRPHRRRHIWSGHKRATENTRSTCRRHHIAFLPYIVRM